MLFGVHTGPGAFYKLMPHNAMALLFGRRSSTRSSRSRWACARSGAISASPHRPLAIRLRSGRRSRTPVDLRYLDGGGVGCFNDDEQPTDRRRIYHHLTFYGFLLCFAATSVATLYHYLLGREAPYPWYDLPVVLGTLGGIGLLIGPVGLLAAKLHARSRAGRSGSRIGMDVAFIAMLFLTSLTGLVLLVLCATPARWALLLARASWRRVRAVPHDALWQVRARPLSFPGAGAIRAGKRLGYEGP